MPQIDRATSCKIGELLVELELVKRGWHVERLDGSTKAVNGDLIALKNEKRCVVQVKTTLSERRAVFLGYSLGFLRNQISFFNSKPGGIKADYIVTVSGEADAPNFHILSVAEAEKMCQDAATKWNAEPKRDGTQRSQNFPVKFRHHQLEKHKDAWEKIESLGLKS